jgi:hypothetical protein
MFLPSITVDMIHARMTEVWTQANLAYRIGKRWLIGEKMREYDYLSHWQVISN